MSSGFVSGGTSDAPIERNDEWLAAQREIEANIVKKQEANRQAATGRSLFETLEANKAAKEEAFQEANRLKNQFRALDADEAEFLDSVLESTRAEEERVKRETAEGLQLFRQQQDEADKKVKRGSAGGSVEEGSPAAEEESWVAGSRKRKRIKEKEVLKGVKIRRSSTTGKAEKDASPPGQDAMKLRSVAPTTSESVVQPEVKVSSQSKPSASVNKKPPAVANNSLVNYGSDEEDDW